MVARRVAGALALALALVLFAGIFLRALAITYPEPTPDQADQCQEDMSCWDCATMGNLICGLPVLP